ncbi:hypothetical protein PFISCL1PPCAC_22273, partial [Pristionchus fissidentatus]
DDQLFQSTFTSSIVSSSFLARNTWPPAILAFQSRTSCSFLLSINFFLPGLGLLAGGVSFRSLFGFSLSTCVSALASVPLSPLPICRRFSFLFNESTSSARSLLSMVSVVPNFSPLSFFFCDSSSNCCSFCTG